MFPLCAPKIFEIAVGASVVQSRFSKVTLLEISKSPLLIGFAGLQYIVCNAVRN